MPSERRRTGAGPGRPRPWRARRGRDVRAKSDPRRAVASVDGQALRDLVATVAGDARLVRVPVNQPPWTPTGLAVTAGEDVSWLAWASPRLLRPLGPALCSRLVLRGRAGDGVPVQGTRDTVTFRADRTGQLRLGSAYPGELQADGTITTDRIPYRAMSGTLLALLARWAPGSDPQCALESIAGRDPSRAGDGVIIAGRAIRGGSFPQRRASRCAALDCPPRATARRTGRLSVTPGRLPPARCSAKPERYGV